MNELLTVSDVATRLNVSPATVYSAVDSGEIDCYRIRTGPGKRGAIRFSEQMIQDYLEGRKQTSRTVVTVKPLRNLTLE